MSVVLLILKILGIVLLAILGLVLLALILVLFVPVRYRVSGDIRDVHKPDFSVRIRLSWLLSVISYTCVFEDGQMDDTFRIFGIRKRKHITAEDLMQEDEAEDEAVVPEDEATAQGDEATAPGDEATAPGDEATAPGDEATAQEEKAIAPEGKAAGAEAREDSCGEAGQTSVQPCEDIVSEKKTGSSAKKERKREKTAENRRRFSKEDLSHWKQKIHDIKKQLTDETNKTVMSLLWKEVCFLFRHFKFRKLYADLAFSAGDPATTGQALGVLSLFPFIYQYEVRICPDFESDEFYIKGEFDVRGRVRAVHFVVSVVRLISKKEVRSLIRRFIK